MTAPTAPVHPARDGARQSVLVVGAGPVGLVAACELARHGVVPRVVDALPRPTTQSRAVGVQPRSQEMLATLGVLERLQDRALPQAAIAILAPRPGGLEQLVRIGLTEVPSRFPALLNLPQTDTEAVLRDRAAELGVVVERGVTLTGLTEDDDGVQVALATAEGVEQTRVDWVVGADGGHSRVRAAVGSRLAGRFRGSHFVVADVSLDSGLGRDTTWLFAAPGGLSVMMRMRHDRSRLMFQVPDPGPGAPAPTFEEVQRLARRRMGSDVHLHHPTSISRYTIHHAQVPQYRVGRVLLAGDAAHIHSPAGGQGMNTGMQDAANLAWKLALVCRGRADARLLDSYHDERHPVGAAVVRRTTWMANAMTLPGPAALARNTVMRALGRVRPLRRALAESITEVAVSYRRSPVVSGTGRRPRRAPDPGVHAADVPGLTAVTGEPVAIGELLRRPGHVLLALDTDPAVLARLSDALGPIGTVVPVVASAAGAAATAVVDPRGAIARQYGVGPRGLVLIRPDGYLGHLSTSPDVPALRAHLATRLHVVSGCR